jgi:hypothetical protein
MLATMLVMLIAGATAHAKMEMRTFPVLAGAGAHDVYPAPDGAVWFTAQSAGKLGRLDPRTSSRGEMLWGGRRGWQFRRLHQSMECRDAPTERFEQVPRRPGPR